MSRIGKQPIPVPNGVEIKIEGKTVSAKGSKVTLSHTLPQLIDVTQEGSELIVSRANESRQARSLHGLSRTLIANLIIGVSEGFKKQLEIRGVGYRAASTGSQVTLNLGYSHPIEYTCPEGVTVSVEKNTQVTITGADKQAVGQAAATIRGYRPPEPYKGKGIRYADEFVATKEGKSA